ncbi:MAG: hypothetical protein ABI239_14640 [Aquihabitans sp.]
MPERSNVEEALGRRLRPWWGQAPGTLIVRGVIQGAIFGLLSYGCIQVLAGNVDLTDPQVAEYERWIDLAATIGLVLAGLGIVYSAIRIVVGGLDVAGRKTVEGVLLSARQRHLGDVLPGPVKWGLEMRRRQQARRQGHYNDGHYRRTRLQIVVQTPDGPKSWNVRQKHFHEALIGQPIRLTATPLLGYVRNLEAVADGSSTTI